MRRFILVFSALLITGCHPTNDGQTAQSRRPATAPAEQEVENQHLAAFGGTIVGRNDGEWGGEVAFKAPSGATYTVVADNSVGIFDMPYGVIAITGLAHLGINRGEVHLLSRPKGSHVTATLLTRLPGAPCDVAREGDRITMRIESLERGKSDRPLKPNFECYALLPGGELVQYECSVPPSNVCVS